MLENILNIEGVKSLNKTEQHQIFSGTLTQASCEENFECLELAWEFGTMSAELLQGPGGPGYSESQLNAIAYESTNHWATMFCGC